MGNDPCWAPANLEVKFITILFLQQQIVDYRARAGARAVAAILTTVAGAGAGSKWNGSTTRDFSSPPILSFNSQKQNTVPAPILLNIFSLNTGLLAVSLVFCVQYSEAGDCAYRADLRDLRHPHHRVHHPRALRCLTLPRHLDCTLVLQRQESRWINIQCFGTVFVAF